VFTSNLISQTTWLKVKLKLKLVPGQLRYFFISGGSVVCKKCSQVRNLRNRDDVLKSKSSKNLSIALGLEANSPSFLPARAVPSEQAIGCWPERPAAQPPSTERYSCALIPEAKVLAKPVFYFLS